MFDLIVNTPTNPSSRRLDPGSAPARYTLKSLIYLGFLGPGCFRSRQVNRGAGLGIGMPSGETAWPLNPCGFFKSSVKCGH